jgi:hypothetical protein
MEQWLNNIKSEIFTEIPDIPVAWQPLCSNNGCEIVNDFLNNKEVILNGKIEDYLSDSIEQYNNYALLENIVDYDNIEEWRVSQGLSFNIDDIIEKESLMHKILKFFKLTK